MKRNKLSKISILLCLIAVFFQKKSFCDSLNTEDIPNFLFDFQNINKRIFPILGMPVTLFQVINDNQEVNILNNIVSTCEKVEAVYKKLRWGNSFCLNLPWRYDFVSELGRPLLYWEYSSNDENYDKKNTTVILGGVHADELTPVHMAFKIAKTLHDYHEKYRNIRVIVAPLVNPDGFFANPFKRTNSNGVDLNRNFPTQLWSSYAYKQWFNSPRRDARKFPGNYANSEQGTRFQTDLIKKFNPDRIISIHAPLAFLDLDYDNKQLFKKAAKLSNDQKKAREIAKIISKNAGNYRILNFGIYPGSLGNYAGNERSIPTITLELSSSDPRKVNKFWNDFSPGIFKSLNYEFKPHQLADLKKYP